MLRLNPVKVVDPRKNEPTSTNSFCRSSTCMFSSESSHLGSKSRILSSGSLKISWVTEEKICLFSPIGLVSCCSNDAKDWISYSWRAIVSLIELRAAVRQPCSMFRKSRGFSRRSITLGSCFKKSSLIV